MAKELSVAELKQLDVEQNAFAQMEIVGKSLIVSVRGNSDGNESSGWLVIETCVVEFTTQRPAATASFSLRAAEFIGLTVIMISKNQTTLLSSTIYHSATKKIRAIAQVSLSRSRIMCFASLTARAVRQPSAPSTAQLPHRKLVASLWGY